MITSIHQSPLDFYYRIHTHKVSSTHTFPSFSHLLFIHHAIHQMPFIKLSTSLLVAIGTISTPYRLSCLAALSFHTSTSQHTSSQPFRGGPISITTSFHSSSSSSLDLSLYPHHSTPWNHLVTHRHRLLLSPRRSRCSSPLLV